MRSEAQADLTAALALAAELGAELTATSTLPELVTTLERRIKWLIPATGAVLCLPEDDPMTYSRVTREARVIMRIGADPLSWSLRRGVGMHIPDRRTSDGYPPGVIVEGSGALVTLPLTGSMDLVGILALYATEAGALDRTDRGLLHLIATQVSSAVQVARLMDELDNAEAVITGMARALEARDAYTAGRSDRVTQYAVELATAARVSFAVRNIVARSGQLHDIGKIGVPDAVLLKQGPLTDEEFAIIKRHPEIGDDICRPLRSLQRLRAGVRHHHERYDGQGYPDGLVGTDIPIEGRILAIADTFDAMTSSRPYRAGMPIAKALGILAANEGPQWDPALLAIFLQTHELERAA